MNDLLPLAVEDTPSFLLSDDPVKVARLRTLLSLACEWYWQTDASLKFSWLSRGALHITGVISSDLVGKWIWDTENFIPAFNMEWGDLQKNMEEKKIFQNFLLCYLTSLNKLVTLSFSGTAIFSEEGDFIGYAGLAHHLPDNVDQTTNKNLLLTDCDPLTGRGNHKVMSEAFIQGLMLASRKGRSLLGVINIHFPSIQTLLKDHSLIVIQKVLLEICQRITQNVRKSDVFGRLEMDSFCILLREITQAMDIERITQKIKQIFEATPIDINHQAVYLEVQCVYLIPKISESFEDVIKELDASLPQS